MSSPDPITAETWEKKAHEQLRTAEILSQAHRWTDAFYHAGFAVECPLKCRIMRVQRLNQWPERGVLHTHDLTKLADFAGLTDALLAEIASLSAMATAWQTAKDWNVGVRYDPGLFPCVAVPIW